MALLATHRRSERGQGSLETVGVVVLASILVAATTGVVVQSSPALRSEVGYRVCQITSLGGGCEDPGDKVPGDDGADPDSPWGNENARPDGKPVVDESRLPDEPCVVSSTSGSISATGSFVVSATGEQGMTIETLSDGTYRVSVHDAGALGYGVGIGVDGNVVIDGVQQGSTAFAGADIALAGLASQTYYAGSEQELQDLLVRVAGEQALDQVAPRVPGPADIPFVQDIPVIGDVEGPPNPVRWAVDQLAGAPPEPDEQYVQMGLEGEAGLALAGIVYSAGAELDMGLYAGARTTPEGYVLTSIAQADGSAWASAFGGEAQGMAGGTLVREIHLGPDGTPLGITMTLTAGANAQSGDVGPATDTQDSYVATAYVPFTGDVATDAGIYLSAADMYQAGQFVQTAMDTGTVSLDQYEVDPNTYGAGLDVDIPALGEGFGAGIEGDLTNSTMVSSSYWDGSGFVDRGC
ncbi:MULTISPECIES: hypothetical protein [unclassified Aeromicrobium]|uniref:hypothetical protein n=1 Tax=unclassified Aeromicrobium TaxID=2633570 RepID=UPI002889ED55|nr:MULTISPECIES: hypothetical protein [unclassified Aeromicrobium]